jgi:hypothetical protein
MKISKQAKIWNKAIEESLVILDKAAKKIGIKIINAEGYGYEMKKGLILINWVNPNLNSQEVTK